MRDWSKLRNDEMRWEVCVVYWHAWWHYIPQTMGYSHVLYHIRQCCRMWYICQQKKMRTEQRAAQRAVLFTGSAKCAGERETKSLSFSVCVLLPGLEAVEMAITLAIAWQKHQVPSSPVAGVNVCNQRK